jgi:SLT domain-containing protein
VSNALSLAGSSQQLVDAVLYQMQTESGGNPYAINKWDSNWAAGHPSVGLMQVIAGTFAAYAGQFRGTGPFAYGVSENPLANTYSAIKYAQANYGPGLRNAYGGIGTGHGYETGSWNVPHTGPAVIHRGEMVIPARAIRGGGAPVVLEIHGGSGTFDQFLLKWIQEHVRIRGGGNVQTAFGRK